MTCAPRRIWICHGPAMLAHGGAALGVAMIYKGIVAPAGAVTVLLAVWFTAGGWLPERGFGPGWR